ncbi:MAG: hypothetical protein KDA84_07400 [Planctomycetaceae bacterium]|nr:hypothetical protein [Planctomycetaceae bacterium]
MIENAPSTRNDIPPYALDEPMGLGETANRLRGWFGTICDLGVIGILYLLGAYFFSPSDPVQDALAGDYKAVVAAVEKDPGLVNRRSEKGWTPLYAATVGDLPSSWTMPIMMALSLVFGPNT